MDETTQTAATERQRIREAADRYFYFADTHDAERVARCFAPQGLLRSLTQPEMHLVGRAAIEEGFRGFARRGPSMHAIATMIIDLGQGTATSRMLALSHVAPAFTEGQTLKVRGLAYTDQWVLDNGDWLLAERVHQSLWQHEAVLVPHVLPPPVPGPA